MKTFFHELIALQQRGETICLATLIERTGSAPRSAGARMAVLKDGSIAGTIGGGALEAQVITAALAAFDQPTASQHSFNFNARDASDLGMICGGSVKVLIEPQATLAGRIEVYQALVDTLQNRQTAWLVTGITENAATAVEVRQGLLLVDGKVVGEIPAEPGELLQLASGIRGLEPIWQAGTVERFLFEPVHARGEVILFGAGHVAQMLAPLAAWVGFYTVVSDDRAEFASRERFASADEVRVLPSFDRCLEGMEIGSESCIVIVTRGHLADRTVLEQALRTRAEYIGMIGSVRKTRLIYDALLENGFSQADLQRVHAPIGLEIGAETPEEIAISILGELIAHRAMAGR